jgi:hypothetical protein
MALFAKLWTDILSDPKLLRGARKGAKQLHLLPWLIAFAKHADDSGRLTVNGDPAEPEDIAHTIPCVTPRQVAQCIAELEELGVLVRTDDETEAVRFSAWEERNRSKKSDSPDAIRERVSKHRQKKRASKTEVVETATHSHSGNAFPGGVTKATEQEQEKEQEKEREQEDRRRARRNAALQEIRNAPRFRVLAAACSPDELGDVEGFLLSRAPDKRRLWVASIADDIEGRTAGGPDLAGACRDALVADPPITGPAGLRAFVARKRSELAARVAAAPPARLPTPEQRAETDRRNDEREKTRNIAEARYHRELNLACAQWEIAHLEESKAIRAKHPVPENAGRFQREAMEENVRREIASIIQYPSIEKWLEESPKPSAAAARAADPSIENRATG